MVQRSKLHSVALDPARVQRAALSAFCESLSPDDWLQLEQLTPKLRNELLRQAVALMLRRRPRR